ncbi:MAG TPA: GerMN domain-containing protein [Acidimicrobiales bacterium]|nr:GerMN domain-containing protein [Acidimicrobiales bacterium]
MIQARALPRPRARARMALGVVVLLGSLAACGIPGDEGPRAIDQEQIPDQGAAAGGAPGDGRTALADLYFTTHDGTRDRLVVVQRQVPAGGSASAPTPSTVLENLLLGTQEGDDPVGDTNLENVVTLIPPQTQLASPPELADGILTVDLNTAINGVQGEGARSAYGQLVCTADALVDVRGVLFSIDGEPVNAPTAGENSGEPLTCDDYANMVAVAAE